MLHIPFSNTLGEEFHAVFLSTVEPTDKDGKPVNPVTSICNEYVFNTVITRARSLLYTAGNPFLLFHMCASKKPNFWAEYIQRCIQCQTLTLTGISEDTQDLCSRVSKLTKMVFPLEAIEEATLCKLDRENIDIIVEQYIEDLNKRSEYKRSMQLVMRGEELRWRQSGDGDEDVHNLDEETNGVVWCTLECKSYHTTLAHPQGSGHGAPIRIEGLSNRRGAFHGDVVKIDTIKKCVLLDEETERAVCETHFGSSFLCRVNAKNHIQFFPLDIRHPKFVNLPTITSRGQEKMKQGVFCFDPSSIKNGPKVSNFIPMERATEMLFIVKFLGWTEQFPYPLGIIVGALPSGNSVVNAELALTLANNVLVTEPPLVAAEAYQCQSSAAPLARFDHAITIDPEGSDDHDDAISCRLIKNDAYTETYEIGVHITNVTKFVPQGGELDRFARNRGCAIYRDVNDCISTMLPKKLVNRACLKEGRASEVFSITMNVTMSKGQVVEVSHPSFKEGIASSLLELTYTEAQAIICGQHESQPDLLQKVSRFDRRVQQVPKLSQRLMVLHLTASYLRKTRLGMWESKYIRTDEPGLELSPEAHILVEELMVWANSQVAKLLFKTFPDGTILKHQKPLEQQKLDSLRSTNGPEMALSLALRRYTLPDQVQCKHMLILANTLRSMLSAPTNRELLRCVQFENKHPQFRCSFISLYEISTTAPYVVSSAEGSYSHDNLQCEYYTHFTSPVRRYVDIVIQRQLHAALTNQPNPYTKEELSTVCGLAQEAYKRSNNYKRKQARLQLAEELLQGGRECLLYVKSIESGQLCMCSSDPAISIAQRESKIKFQNLNASRIEILKTACIFTWKVKMVSASGSLEDFLNHPQMATRDNNSSESLSVDLCVLRPTEQSMRQCQIPNVGIVPYTCKIPCEAWKSLQAWVTSCGEHMPSVDNLKRKLIAPKRACLPAEQPSPLWLYTIKKPISQYEVMNVQLSSSCKSHMLSPHIQLVEVAPNLMICLEHNSTPAQCFSCSLKESASKESYSSVESYIKCWEPVLLAEGAVSSVAESELLIIQNAPTKWPRLDKCTRPSGQVCYKVPDPMDGVKIELPATFVQYSYDFLKINKGDLACLRCKITDRSGKQRRFTFHMVIHNTEIKETTEKVRKGVNIYLKFISQDSNVIPPALQQEMKDENIVPCDIQLIPLSLPLR